MSLAHRRLSMGQDPYQEVKLEHKDEQRISRPSLLNQTLMRSQGMTCLLLPDSSRLPELSEECKFCCSLEAALSISAICAGSFKAVLKSLISPFAVPKPPPPAREAAAYPLQSALRSSISQRRSTSAQVTHQGEGNQPEDYSGAGQAPRRSYSLRRTSTVRFSDEQEANTHEGRTIRQ